MKSTVFQNKRSNKPEVHAKKQKIVVNAKTRWRLELESKLSNDIADKCKAVTSFKHELPRITSCLTRSQFRLMRNDIVKSVTVLSKRDLCRKKLARYKCVLRELEEDGLHDAADFFRDMIQENVDIITLDELGISIDLRTVNNRIIDKIDVGLREASQARSWGDVIGESSAFLKLAIYFSYKVKGFYWIAEKFLLIATAIATQTHLEAGRQEAQCYYSHGRFILNKFPAADMSEAEEYLKCARCLANGRDWQLDRYIIKQEKSYGLFENASSLLHRIYICRSRNIRVMDPFLSERLARIAVKRAIDAGSLKLRGVALMESGLAQIQNKDYLNAVKSTNEALEILYKYKSPTGICEGLLCHALALIRNDEEREAIRILKQMGMMALKNKLLQQHLGRALRFLGELYLGKDAPKFAAIHLSEAYACFNGAIDSYAYCPGVEQSAQSLLHEEEKKPKKVDCVNFNEKGNITIDQIFLQNQQTVIDEDDADTVNFIIGLVENIFIAVLNSDEDNYSTYDEPFRNVIINAESTQSFDEEFGAINLKEEINQTHLLNAVAVGQSRLESFYDMVIESKVCKVAASKLMNYKLRNVAFWIAQKSDQQIACHCPKHNRTALDVVKYNLLDAKAGKDNQKRKRDAQSFMSVGQISHGYSGVSQFTTVTTATATSKDPSEVES